MRPSLPQARTEALLTKHPRHFLARAARLDLDVFRRVATAESSVLDKTLPRLTRAADHSKLWIAIAGGLALSGSRKGRAAAGRGVVALGLASALVNVPIKMALRRKRPDSEIVPIARRLARMPASSSFPSGHSASAAAFAFAVSREFPAAGAVVAPLAASVAFSRIYTGAHYPGDVLAGVAAGAFIGANARRIWRGAEIAAVQTHLDREAIDPSPDGDGIAVVVNPNAGPALSSSPSETLRNALPGMKIIEDEDDITDALRRAAEEATGGLGVAGGDGTVNSAAEEALRRDVPLAIFPAGTLNHLARDLGIDSEDETIEGIKTGTVAHLDVGRIAGRQFLNTASFGAYTDLVDEREKLESTIGKWPAALIAAVRVLARSTPAKVEVNGHTKKIWAIFVGNCQYEPRGFAPATRPQLRDDTFDVRVLTKDGPWSRVRILLAALTGDLSRTSAYQEHSLKRLSVRSLNGTLRLAADGETFDGPAEFTIEKDERDLRVFVAPETAR